jgi:hypothetical protein
MEAVLPAAPAAVRLSLTVFQTCSRLQELTGKENSPVSAVLLTDGVSAMYQRDSRQAMGFIYDALLELGAAIHKHSSSLHTMARAQELLLCPQLISGLASTVLMAVLCLSTGTEQATGNGSGPLFQDAMRPASSSESNAGSSISTASGSSRGGPGGSGKGGMRSSAGHHQPGSSSSRSSSNTTISGASGDGRLGNKLVSLDSLTPLSCQLFDLLGIHKEGLLEAARGADVCRKPLPYFRQGFAVECILEALSFVLDYQVSFTWRSSKATRLLAYKHITIVCAASGSLAVHYTYAILSMAQPYQMASTQPPWVPRFPCK